MSDQATFNAKHYAPPRDYSDKNYVVFLPLLHFVVGLWIFSGGFVLIEPSPYELLFALVLPIAMVARVGVYKETLSLLAIIILFIPFAIISAFQATFFSLSESLIYISITSFLFLTAFFLANYIADAPFNRMKVVMGAYLAIALITAIIGTLAYLKLIPGEEIFLRYDRAKAFFKDPNVYGPFLILPAMFMLQKLFFVKLNKAFFPAIFFGILAIGVFASFSRAAWGSLLFAAILLFGLSFTLIANAKEKVHMIILALVGGAVGIVALLGLLSIPEVNKLFVERFSLVQSYDGGSTGRFGRQAYAFELAIENPLGIGPGEFASMRIKEEPHNTYVNNMLVYGWGGGLAFFFMFVLTLKRGIGVLYKKSKNRVLMIPLIATFIPLVIEAAIIDINHWRHLFLITGLIWGVSAGYFKISKRQIKEKHLLI